MALDRNDLQLMEEMVGRVVKTETASLRHELMDAVKQTVADQAELIIDQTRSEMRASENRLMTEIRATENRLEAKIDAVKVEIVDEVSDLIGNSIVSQIDDHEVRITKLETKIA